MATPPLSPEKSKTLLRDDGEKNGTTSSGGVVEKNNSTLNNNNNNNSPTRKLNCSPIQMKKHLLAVTMRSLSESEVDSQQQQRHHHNTHHQQQHHHTTPLLSPSSHNQELKNIATLANQLRAGSLSRVDLFQPQQQQQQQQQQKHHPRGGNGGGSTGNLQAVRGGGGGGVVVPPPPHLPHLPHSSGDIIAETSYFQRQSSLAASTGTTTSCRSSLADDHNIVSIDKEKKGDYYEDDDTAAFIRTTTTPATAQLPPPLQSTSSFVGMPSSKSESTTTEVEGVDNITLPNDLFRIGIVISDCCFFGESNNSNNKFIMDESVNAIANPVSKCQVISLTVLNVQQKSISVVKKEAKEWIRKNYTAGLRRHQQLYLHHHNQNQHTDHNIDQQQQQRPSTSSSLQHNVNCNREYHSTELLLPSNDTEVDDEEEDNDDNKNNNMTEEQVKDTVYIDKSSNVEILIGENGFQRLLQGQDRTKRGDEKNNNKNNSTSSSSSSYVDAVYLIIRDDAKKQHNFTMDALKSYKHVLLNDPVSTSLYDFCKQFALAKTVNRFVQFSTMFVHQYRVKTFLDCVTSSECFGNIDSIDVILNVNYNDINKIVTNYGGTSSNGSYYYPPTRHEDACIHRLGRFCVLITTLILSRASWHDISRTTTASADKKEEHRPISAQVTSFTTLPDNNTIANDQTNYPTTGIPQSAECEVKFTNNRTLTFAVQYSSAPTRQVLTVRGQGRIATMSDFVIPHPDGLSTCRLYDASHTVLPSAAAAAAGSRNSRSGGAPLDVFTGEAVDMPSGPPQDVIMWRRFCELCRAIEQEGWETKDDIDMYTTAAVAVNHNDKNTNNTNNSSLGLDVDDDVKKSPHSSTATGEYKNSILYQQFDSFASTVISPSALEAQEARDITDVSIQTKCILMALTKSCLLGNESNNDSNNNGSNNSKEKKGPPVPVELPEVW